MYTGLQNQVLEVVLVVVVLLVGPLDCINVAIILLLTSWHHIVVLPHRPDAYIAHRGAHVHVLVLQRSNIIL